MRISQLAERSGVPATTLRYYESRGLLPARRSAAGYRLYGRDSLDRLAFIGAGKRLGLGLEEITTLLEVWRDGACAQVKASLRPRVAQRVTAARAQAEELSAFIAVLRGALDHLDALPDRAGPCDPECDFLDPAGRGTARTPLPLLDPDGQGSPVACSLDADDAREDRAGQWRALLRDAHHEWVPGGVRFALPAERAGAAADLAAAEQRCCSFFSFTLVFRHDMVHLEVGAPGRAPQVLTNLFGDPDATSETEQAPPC